MKRLILTILCLLLAVPCLACDWINTFDGKCSGGEPEQLAMLQGVVGSGGSATSCSLYDSQLTYSTVHSVGYDANYTYIGQANYIPATDINVCRVDFYVSATTGARTGYTYTAYIYNMATTALNTLVTNGTSSSIATVDLVAGWNSFIFDPPAVVSATTTYGYGIVINQSTVSSSNYVDIGGKSSSGPLSGTWAKWNAVKNMDTDYTPADIAIRIYEQ